MIELYFPAKKAPVVTNVASATTELVRAAKMQCSVEEYRSRVVAVAKEYTSCDYKIGDTVYPTDKKAADKYGKCIVTGICGHYDDYGDVDWHEPPFIVSFSPLKDRNTSIQCTVGYVARKETEGAC